MTYSFYKTAEYQNKLALLSKRAWKRGCFDHLRAKIKKRRCKRVECENVFNIKEYDPKRFCSKTCAATYNNILRGSRDLLVRLKISRSLKEKNPGTISLRKGIILVPRLVKNCPTCNKRFETPRWQNHKYCSVRCSIKDIGGRRTSPRAARAKAGIRSDLGEIYFYSRWEANFARLLNLLHIEWAHQPKSFDLGTQRYTPDFYLPRYDLFIEIKNFLSDFSANRDKKFREKYPEVKLKMLLKGEYLRLQERYAPLIKNWEYS